MNMDRSERHGGTKARRHEGGEKKLMADRRSLLAFATDGHGFLMPNA